MDFIAAGLVELLAGLTSAAVLAAYAWWAPLLLGRAWLLTHWLLRESGVWRDRNTDIVREAQRHADYAYRLAVDAPSAKELRLFGLAGWIVDRFRRHRKQLHDLRWEATKLRERPVATSLAVVLGANVVVFWSMAADANAGALGRCSADEDVGRGRIVRNRSLCESCRREWSLASGVQRLRDGGGSSRWGGRRGCGGGGGGGGGGFAGRVGLERLSGSSPSLRGCGIAFRLHPDNVFPALPVHALVRRNACVSEA